MRNILLWVGIAALALQDYFKKQPVKTTRQQQFLQTGETSQAFIGTTFAGYKKILSNYFGKPIKVKSKLNGKTIRYKWYVKEIEMDFYSRGKIQYLYLNYKDGSWDNFAFYDWNGEEVLKDIVQTIFIQLRDETHNEDYKKLYDIAKAGDWELALEIAKSQNLL